MRTTLVLLLAVGSSAFALCPLESDHMLAEGEFVAVDGRVEFSSVIPFGRRIAGWYANVEGLDSFALHVNGRLVAAFGKEDLPRTRIRGLDMSAYVSRLRLGANTVELHTPNPGPFWLRMWMSDNAWYPSNFHAHTTYSDGAYSVHDLLQMALSEGANAYALTDHNTLAQCYDTAFHPVGSLQPIRGTEWTSDLGHANVLGSEGAAWFDSTISVRQMLDDASYRGGTVQVNHPCDDELGFGWDRYPLLDSSIDYIEIFNNLTWFPPSPNYNDREAIAWWHSLLVQGKTIAATGNSDFHGNIPGEGGPMESQTRVWAPSNHPDTILKYAKLGQAMILDESDDGRIYVYADTNNNGFWDLVMGQHARISTARTIRFRAEIEDADFLDDFWVYNRSGTVHNHWFANPLGPWDHAYEWNANYNSSSRDFVRAYHENAINDPELATNAIYVNHPGYELGPTALLSQTVNRPDTLMLPSPETLRFRLTNTAGFSPWRFGLAVACDTAHFDIINWQTAGPGIGQAQNRSGGNHELLEWQGGYTWANRLAVNTSFDYWLVVRPKAGGRRPVLFRSWAHDRIQIVELEPESGFFGPEGQFWHCESVYVKVLDVQPVSIDVPGSTIDSSAPVLPQATVRNNGNTTVTFAVSLTIGTGYSGSVNVAGLGPGATRQVSFSPAWQPLRGTHPIRCVTLMAGDRIPANDTLESTVQVKVHDAAAIAISRPSGTIPPGAVTPEARVSNLGTDREPLRVHFSINSVPPYDDSVELPAGLPPGVDTIVTFSEWLAVVGTYAARCSTGMATDQVPANDTTSLAFVVRSSLAAGWQERTPVPGPALIKDGGWLAVNQASGLIYCCKGNKSNEFCAYEPNGDTYATLAAIPQGPSGRLPKKGCDGITDGENYVYMTKGNNTFEFWRYDISANLWESLPPVPEGASGKGCKKGTDLSYVTGLDADYVYLLKGYGPEFYRFDVESRVWEPLTDVPAGARPKVDEGSWLCWDEGTTVYFLKAKYAELWPYDLGAAAWGTQLPSMPLVHPQVGKKKKPKDGGAGAWYDGSVYALKGGNTCEFWRYTPGDSWHELDTMPQVGSTGKKKRVKTGGDIVNWGACTFFATKGNKTLELWRYVKPLRVPRSTPSAIDGVVAGEPLTVGSCPLTIYPNPLAVGDLTLRYSTPAPGRTRVYVYDALGRLATSAVWGLQSEITLDLRSLSNGVYLVRLVTNGFTTTRKFVVER